MYRLLNIIAFVILIGFLGSGFLTYLIFNEFIDLIQRYRENGAILYNKFKYTRKNQEIVLSDINNIQGVYSRNFFLPFATLLDVDTSNGVQTICLNDDEVVKLVDTELNQISISTKWDFDKKLILIVPSTNDEQVHISYDSVGRFALEPYLPSLLGTIVFIIAFAGLYFDILGGISFFLGLFVIFAMICFIPPFYKQVSVRLDHKGVILQNENGERLITFGEIAKVEKSVFRTKIITKNDEIIYFPKACYLLPEFISKMTKGNNMISS